VAQGAEGSQAVRGVGEYLLRVHVVVAYVPVAMECDLVTFISRSVQDLGMPDR
jgi:hypothetical protein